MTELLKDACLFADPGLPVEWADAVCKLKDSNIREVLSHNAAKLVNHKIYVGESGGTINRCIKHSEKFYDIRCALMLVMAMINIKESDSMSLVQRVSFCVMPLLLIAFYALTSIFYYEKRAFSFDEPHYLLAAQSIARDFDFDLKNNYNKESYKNIYSGILDPHISPNSQGKHWYSIHGYGLPVLLAPGYIAGEALAPYVGGLRRGLDIGVGIILITLTLFSFLLLSDSVDAELFLLRVCVFMLFLVKPCFGVYQVYCC
ncbi:hypothetical protein MIT9_P0499 [Methylomarinovum caldicuralii]|uniref:Uncharacterized protein n=1 Tax=Methylomarinovum caldicuralii TaxID=438856 RepID=A0AAU9BR12_9GAMM|nr:hypothetical protein [Methylomarinovum caldicuralii]BCX80921.1 hypothetical protein MIT9_P0499 [Methylomarinovum caldicuralii]